MHPQTREQCVATIAALCAAYGREADEAMFAAYEIGLDGLTAAEIKLAAAKA